MDAGGLADLMGVRGLQPCLRAYKARLPEPGPMGVRGLQPRLRAYKARLPELGVR